MLHKFQMAIFSSRPSNLDTRCEHVHLHSASLLTIRDCSIYHKRYSTIPTCWWWIRRNNCEICTQLYFSFSACLKACSHFSERLFCNRTSRGQFQFVEFSGIHQKIWEKFVAKLLRTFIRCKIPLLNLEFNVWDILRRSSRLNLFRLQEV